MVQRTDKPAALTLPDDSLEQGPSREQKEAARVRDSALRLLARREHSQKELHQKLRLREFDGDAIERVLAQLAEEGMQSDERYAQRYAESRAARRYGPNRILGELSQKGVDAGISRCALDALEVDWADIALEALTRMHGDPEAFKDRAQMSQKLYRRGFSQDTIRQALSLQR